MTRPLGSSATGPPRLAAYDADVVRADDPTAPTWRHRRRPGPMTCARCDTLAPGGIVVDPRRPGWTGVVLIDSGTPPTSR